MLNMIKSCGTYCNKLTKLTKPATSLSSHYVVMILFLAIICFSATINTQPIASSQAADTTSLTQTTGGNGDWFGQTFGGHFVLEGDNYAEAKDHPELDVGDAAGESLTIEARIWLTSWTTVLLAGALSINLTVTVFLQ